MTPAAQSLADFAENLANEEEAALRSEEAAEDAAEDQRSEDRAETEAGPNSEPGEQGVATLDEPEEKPEPTQEEIELAGEVLSNLRGRARAMGAEATIEGLLQVVDTHPEFVTPDGWPGDEEDEYRDAPIVQRIASILLAGCPKLEISPRSLVCLWRNKEEWTSRGVTVRSAARSFNKRTRFLMDGSMACIEVNYHLFRASNPLQKIFMVYDALRELDGEGKSRPHDFRGYFDELELFGPGVFREMVTLANALERGRERDLPHQLSLLDEVDDE